MTATKSSRTGALCRHLRLVLPHLAPGLLPGRDEAGRVPRPLLAAAAERRAQLDGLPDSGRRTVPPLGRANARGVPLRREDAGVPASPGGDVRGAGTAAGAAARSDPDPRRAGADEGFLTLALGSLHPEQRIAFDFRHESWVGIELPENAVRVNDYEAEAPFRYLRFREPPYSDRDVAGHAEQLRPLVENGVEVYCYYRHEDEPTAPRYAERLLELV